MKLDFLARVASDGIKLDFLARVASDGIKPRVERSGTRGRRRQWDQARVCERRITCQSIRLADLTSTNISHRTRPYAPEAALRIRPGTIVSCDASLDSQC